MKTRYKIIIVISLIFVGWVGVTGSSMCIFMAEPNPSWLGSSGGCGPSITYEIQKYFGILWYPEIQNMDTSPSGIDYLLNQAGIDYPPDKLVVAGGLALVGDSGGGAVIDTDSETHWFGIDSISEPKKITLFQETPQLCKVNTGSCYCTVHKKLIALTLDELSYFTLQEEEKYAELLIDYLGQENINRTPKFQIGKFNLNYADPSVIGYCGELWGTNTYDFFEGAFVKDIVKNYRISKEISPLCAISDDAQYFGKMFGEIENEN